MDERGRWTAKNNGEGGKGESRARGEGRKFKGKPLKLEAVNLYSSALLQQISFQLLYPRKLVHETGTIGNTGQIHGLRFSFYSAT